LTIIYVWIVFPEYTLTNAVYIVIHISDYWNDWNLNCSVCFYQGNTLYFVNRHTQRAFSK